MTLKELFDDASTKADEYWKRIPKDFFPNMQQDLRAFGRSEEHIWNEFITQAFEHGYLEAKKKDYET